MNPDYRRIFQRFTDLVQEIRDQGLNPVDILEEAGPAYDDDGLVIGERITMRVSAIRFNAAPYGVPAPIMLPSACPAT